MKVGEAEGILEAEFGIKTQIKNLKGTKLIANDMTIGDASREESKK